MTKTISIKFLTTTIFCLLLGIGQVFAQAGSGSITGVVSDATGAVIPSATVKLVNKNNGAEKTATASEDGVYTFTLLQPGNYEVSATSGSFAEQKFDVEVQVGRTTDANFTLGATAVSATVEVTAEGIQTTQNQSDAVLNETAISNLPINGRRFQDFAILTPTAQIDPSRGQISLSGQRGINTNINIDGVDFNQPFFGGIRGGERSNQSFTVPQESIKEFQVVASGYSAEYGRSSGGIVNVVTKTGGNNVRGSLFYLLRPEKLARKNEFVKEIERQRSVDAIPAPTQQQFGGSIGGPIVKNKLFYFGAYEQQIFKAPRRVLFGSLSTIPLDTTATTTNNAEAYNLYRSLETAYDQTNDAYATLIRSDWQINEAHRANVRFNFSRNVALNAVSTGETALDPTTTRALSNNGTERDRNYSVVSQLVSNFGAKAVNELRFQFAHEDRPRIANELSPNISNGVGNYGTRNFLPTTQFDRRVQFTDSLTILSSNHTIKVGGEYSNIFADQTFGFNQFGNYNIGGGNAAALQSLSLTPGLATDRRFDTTASSYVKQIGNLSAAYTVQELSFFGQDSWRISQGLTFNYGLRVENQYNPQAQATNTAFVNLLRNAQFPLRGNRGLDVTNIPNAGWQVGPRVGFAWDPFKNGKTVIRGFSGVYYARTPLIGLAAPFNNFRDPAGDLTVRLPFAVAPATAGAGLPTFNAASFVTNNPQYATITGLTPAFCAVAANFNACVPNTVFRQFAVLGINLNTFSLTSLPTLNTTQLQQISGAVLAATTNARPNPIGLTFGAQPVGIDENFRNPRSFQFGGGFEHEIGRNFVIGLDYSQVNTVFLQRNRDINLPIPTLRSTTIDPAQRPFFGLGSGVARPVSELGSVQIREASARSLFRSLTFRARFSRKWGQFNAYYTLSKSTSDDDNERDAGGTLYDDSFNLIPEYGPSRLDRRHQFVANPVFFLPQGFEVSSSIRLRSGLPVDAIANSDLNQDLVFNDRPYFVPGVPFTRNLFRNRNLYDVDLRAQKGFKFGESRRLVFSAEFFNILNLQNIQLSGSTVTQYCTPSNVRCGLDGITNINFLQLRDQNPTSANFGRLLLNNNPGSQVFQMQLGARFQF